MERHTGKQAGGRGVGWTALASRLWTDALLAMDMPAGHLLGMDRRPELADVQANAIPRCLVHQSTPSANLVSDHLIIAPEEVRWGTIIDS